VAEPLNCSRHQRPDVVETNRKQHPTGSIHIDTTLTLAIFWNGSLWRDCVTGAVK
jgi:hypothetical protein